MANQKRKSANAKSITSNPLFPGVVALWFGALFGLGSLAVRPSLLEELMLGSHIDLVIPAAAPPLGITARILLALAMAALGGILGIMLTRRLTRPEPAVFERKRSAKDMTQSPRTRLRDAHPDAPARRPLSAHDELGGAHAVEDDRAPAMGPGMLANRRRALAIIHEEPQFVPPELAPLPGRTEVEPLDLALLALTPDPALWAAPAHPQMPTASATAPLDWSQPAPVATSSMPAAAPAMLNPLPSGAIEPIAADPAHLDGRQVFGLTQPEPQVEAPRQIFGLVAAGDHLPQDFVKAAGFQTSVFDTPEAKPLFVRPATEALTGIAVPAFTVPITPLNPPESNVAAAAPDAQTSEQLPNPASLDMTDLAARLAESMRRRRARAQVPAPPAVAAPTDAASDEEPTREGPEVTRLGTPTLFVPSTAAEPAPIPIGYGPGPVDADDASSESVATERTPAPVLQRFAPPTPAPAQPSLAPARDMPSAMRPLALDAFLEDDAPFDASLLPPRHIAIPAPRTTQTEVSASFAPMMTQPAAAQDDNEPVDDDSLTTDSADNPYASLLGLAPPRQAFVRINEPEAAAHEAPEPVVIFPGQAPHVAPNVAAAPATGEINVFRRFDAPASAGQGQPVAANSAAATVDPAEAEQALRTALNNLQRMSGAA